MSKKKYSSHYQDQIYSLFNKSAVLYHPELVTILGKINYAVFLGQLLYWYDKGKNPVWVYKTIREIESETGLSRYMQDRAVDRCEELGVIEHRLAGTPAKRHFKINVYKLQELIVSLSESSKLDHREVSMFRARYLQTKTETTLKSSSDKNAVNGYEKFLEAGENLKQKKEKS